MATTIIRPISDYSISTFKNSDNTTVNLYSYIDEDVASPTDFISQIGSDVGHCLFEFSDISINGLINNVRIYLSFIANGVTASGRVYIGGAEYSTSDKTLLSPSISEYGTKYFDFSINPATSLSWTKDDINNIIAGVYFDSTKAGKSIDQLYIEVDYTENPLYDFYLWSVDTLPWQLALPWQFLNGYQIIGSVTNFLISTVNSIMSWGRNLLTSVTAYTISGVNVNLIWESAKVLVAEVANYTITGININLLRPIRNLISSVGEYVISSTGIGLYKGWGMLCEVTSYVISGVNVNLTRLINLLTSVTDYSITTINAIIQRLVILFANTTNYLITTVDTTFTKALNLLLEVTDYTITGIDATFSRLRNLITEKAEYLIIGINVNLLRPIRNMAVSVATYTITTFSVIFRGIGDWLWKWTSKPSASDWTNGSKPTNTYNNDTKI